MANRTWTAVGFTLVASSMIFATAADAQKLVTPDKVTAEAFLDQANQKWVRCGIRWVNMVIDGDRLLAYRINITGWFLPETQQSSTFVGASLRTTYVNHGQSTHVDIAPVDIYLFIQQDPTTYRITPLSADEGAPENWLSGPIDPGGPDGDSGKALAPTLAMQKNVPMVVHLVFDSPGGAKQTLAFNVVNRLPREQDLAFSDCLARAVKRSSP